MEDQSKSVANLKGILGPSKNNLMNSSSKNNTRPIAFGETADPVEETESVDNYTYHLDKTIHDAWSSQMKESHSLDNKLVSR